MTEDRFSFPHYPTELRYSKADRLLHVTFDDGESFELPAELLRVESPSAEVQGHSANQKQLVSGRRHVGIMAIEPVGNYAVRIKFDDLHDTGIFSWKYLRELGEDQEQIFADYCARLEAAGKRREP
jgi:DUF971 family protein